MGKGEEEEGEEEGGGEGVCFTNCKMLTCATCFYFLPSLCFLLCSSSEYNFSLLNLTGAMPRASLHRSHDVKEVTEERHILVTLVVRLV